MAHTIFGKDTTIRLSCRAGDYVLLCGFQGMFASADNLYKVDDLWQLTDGDFVTITNRHVDLSPWFELHPLETSGALALRLHGNYLQANQLGEIDEGPNLWRALTADRLVWVGKKRPGVELNNGVLSIFTFNENAIIIGEPFAIHNGLATFGGFNQKEQSQEDVKLCRNGLNAVLALGLPRVAPFDDKWSIGF